MCCMYDQVRVNIPWSPGKGNRLRGLSHVTYSESIEAGGMMSPSREAISERIDERVGLYKLACDNETRYAGLILILRCRNRL